MTTEDLKYYFVYFVMIHLIKLMVGKNYGRYYGQVQSSGQRRSSAAKELFRSSHRRCSMKKLFLKIVSVSLF